MTTQKEIVKAIAETHDLSLAESKRILSTVFDTIVDVSTVHIVSCTPPHSMSLLYFRACSANL
jgi:hypothetical protein